MLTIVFAKKMEW